MDKEKTIKRLLEKKEKLIETTHKYDNCVRLCRTMWHSNYKNDIDVSRKTSAIDLAIDLLNKHVSEIDLHQYAVMILPATLEDIGNNCIRKADSMYLNEKKECAKFLIKNYLPICRKQILDYI